MLDRPNQHEARLSVDVDQVVGANLRKFRMTKGISLNDVGDFIGVSGEQVRKYEDASNRLPISRALKICKLFRIDLMTLLSGAITSDMPGELSHNAMLLAMTHDAIVDPAQQAALRNLARTMAKAED